MSPGDAELFDIASLTTTAPGSGIVTGSANPGVPLSVPLACQPELEAQSDSAWVGLWTISA